jgi:TonB-linked SusC/RagA family outer membrane protein
MKEKQLSGYGLFMSLPGMQPTLRIMKITTILLTVFCLQVSAGSLAQVTISGKELPLIKVFTAIKKQTDFHVIYDVNDLRDARLVNLDARNAAVQEILDQCMKDQPLEYSIAGKNIFIKRKIESKGNKLLLNNIITSEKVTTRITGKVLNQNNDPVQGATITEMGTTNATSTTADGSFALTVENPAGTLIITGANIEAFEYKLKGQSIVIASVTMKVSKLDEIQVVAYGTKTQRFQTGTVTKVTSEEIARQPVSNPLQALEGRVPGLFVNQTSGLPGGKIKINIRGQNSLRASDGGILPSDEPLFIIDGVPFAPNNNNINLLSSAIAPGTNQRYNNQYGGLSPFNSIDPSTIESIEVLRDADATSIYGSRGANGVILITTKRGKNGKTGVNVNINTGWSKVTKTMDMMNTQQYVQMRKEALANDGITPTVSNSPDLLIFDTTKYTNWKDYFLGNTAKTTTVNASINGGNNNTRYYFGGGYHHETYIFPGNFADKKGSVSAGINHITNDRKLQIDFSANYNFGENNLSGTPNILTAFTMIPNHPQLMDSTGKLLWSYKGINYNTNPLQYLRQEYSAKTQNLVSQFSISYLLFNTLKFRTSLGYNDITVQEHSINPKAAQNPVLNPKGSAGFGTNKVSSWIIEPQLEYNHNFGKTSFSILVGSTFQKNTTNSTVINANNYSNDNLLNSVSAAGSSTVSAASTLYKYAALFARFNIVHDRKYILNLTGRSDASSRFGPSKRIGNFASVGAGWIFTEERWLKHSLKFLSFGKLRASYGSTGSDAIGDFQFVDYWAPVTPNYQGLAGYTPSNLYNPNYSWGVTKKLDLSLEIGLNQDRLVLLINRYSNRSGNQLISYTLPSQTGFNRVTQNFPALVENMGWEFQLTNTNIKNKQFTWNTALNLTVPKNRLVSFPGIENSSYYTLYKVGKSLSVIRATEYLYVNPQKGIFEYNSKNGPTNAPELSTDSKMEKNTDPIFYGGMNNSISYKGFQLDVFIQFTKQNGFNYLKIVYGSGSVGDRFNNRPVELLNRWQKPGDVAYIQKFTTGANGNTSIAASKFAGSDGSFMDASFIRFKNISLTYSLKELFPKLEILNQFRIYAQAQNIFTITKYKGNDPESQSFFGVPPLKTFVIGLNLGL